MKSNLLKASALLLALFFLGSCAEDPKAERKTQTEESSGSTVSVPINFEVSVDAPKSLDQEARAYTGAKTPITVKDGSNKELNDDLSASTVAQKILSRSRDAFVAKNPTLDAILYIYTEKEGVVKARPIDVKLTYDLAKKKYTLGKIENFPGDLLSHAQGASKFTLTLYAGGGAYNSNTKSFEIPSIMEQVSLSNLASNPIELPLLYQSDPVAFKVTGAGEKISLEPAGGDSPSLKPLGSLLLVTFRNNMQQGITFDGITAVSNSFFGPNNSGKRAVYNIETGAFSNIEKYQSPYTKTSNGGSDFTYFYSDFSSGSSSLPGGGGISIASGARSDKALVFWGFHTGGSMAVSASNKISTASGKDLPGDVLNAATSVIHIYGQNVKAGGLTPSRPNYSIAPIGGANLTPENGKAYTLNCEFYEQPRQILGYFAKGYIYKEGSDWQNFDFDGGGTNAPEFYKWCGYTQGAYNNKLLVNSGQASEVRALNGGVSTAKGQMYLPNEKWHHLFGLTEPVAFQPYDANKDSKRYMRLSNLSVAYHAHGIKTQLPYKDDPSASTPFQYKDFVYADYFASRQTVSDGTRATAYRQLYMEPRNSAGLQPRSKYQTIMRVSTTGRKVYVEHETGGANNIYPSTLTMESLYVGKYFFGNILTTPLYVNRGASQPFLFAESGDAFWSKTEVIRDRVDRVALNVPTYEYNQINKTDLLRTYQELKDKKRAEPLMHHWCDAPSHEWEYKVLNIGYDREALYNKIENDLYQRHEEDANSMDNRLYGFADTKGGIWRIVARVAHTIESDKTAVTQRLRTHTYQALRPYSTKYQGNEGFRNNNK